MKKKTIMITISGDKILDIVAPPSKIIKIKESLLKHKIDFSIFNQKEFKSIKYIQCFPLIRLNFSLKKYKSFSKKLKKISSNQGIFLNVDILNNTGYYVKFFNDTRRVLIDIGFSTIDFFHENPYFSELRNLRKSNQTKNDFIQKIKSRKLNKKQKELLTEIRKEKNKKESFLQKYKKINYS